MDLIEKLAELLGFHKSYIDSYGNEKFAKSEAREALLLAMGYQLDENALRQSIQYLQEKAWRSALPATHIVKVEAGLPSITVCLPLHGATELQWQVVTEAAQVLTGSVTTSELNTIEQASFGNETFQKYTLPLPKLGLGYHELSIEFAGVTSQCHLIYAPKSCYSPTQASEKKVWGVAAQLYSLKSEANWGMGDFSDLKALVNESAKQGASVVGLNPLHPLYQCNPAHISPYSPTSRCFLNTLYIDVTAIANYKYCKKAQARVNSKDFKQKLAYAKKTALIDYPAVADIKFEVAELLFLDFEQKKGSDYQDMAAQFAKFKAEQGHDLVCLATFDALYEYFHQLDDKSYGWTDWPKAYQDAQSAEVKAFQASHAERIEYFCFLQWAAHCQLSEASAAAKGSNMPIGLYLDLAVGCDGSGVDVWTNKSVYVSGAAIGASPDALNTLGQDWGLTPMNPVALKEQGYKPLVAALRSNMQYAGALRIDHILGLMRQYWIAPGMGADEGVYITFPLDDILRVIALESCRNECVVIGEDLGNVPDGFNEIMEAAGLLSYKVLFFECWESGLFKRPELYPQQSMATVSTHDLPTLKGWWLGRDLQWRDNLNLYPNNEMGPQEHQRRVTDRQYLLSALADLNVIDSHKAPTLSPAEMNLELSVSVQKYLAHTPSHIHLVTLEDALENIEQVNIPGTIDEHPNWLQKLPVSLDNFWQTESAVEIAKAMREIRPSN